MNITKQSTNSSINIKSSLTYSFSHNENLNFSSSDDQLNDIQDKQECLSDNDILSDSSDNYQLTIEAFQTKVETEVVRILIEIYNSNISEDNYLINSVHQFAKEVYYFSEKLGIQFTVYILQLLTEKLVDLVHRCKLKLNSDKLYKEIELLTVIKTQAEYQKVLEFLSGLESINKALIRSSKDITYVFKSALDTITTSTISIEEILKEIFYKEFIYDDIVIFRLMEQFKYYDNESIRLRKDYNKDLSVMQKTMFKKKIQTQEELKKLNNYLNLYDKEYEDNNEEENKENKVDNNKEIKRNKKKNKQEIIQKGKQEKIDESKCNNLTNDQLLDYINNQSPMIKSKKKKRKNKAKKRSQTPSSNEDDYNDDIIVNQANKLISNIIEEEQSNKKIEDELIDSFKMDINQMSTCAYTTHKIKPLLSNEFQGKLLQISK